MPGYTWADDGKYYKYNTCIGDVFFCPGNIIIEGRKIRKIEEPESQFLIDNFVVDMKKRQYELLTIGIKIVLQIL